MECCFEGLSHLKLAHPCLTCWFQWFKASTMQPVVQQPDYNIAGVEAFQKSMDCAMMLLLNSLKSDFILAVLSVADGLGEAQDLPIHKMLAERNFAEWNRACADFVATTLPVAAGLSPDVKFCGLINGYQGKYTVPNLQGRDERRLVIKNAPRVGSEQLLRRLFVINGKIVYNPFGGFFLAKIQELPYVVKFWMVLRNITEATPKRQMGEDVTINYFAQLFNVKAANGKNLYDGLQDTVQELWGRRFHAEAMDLEQKIRKSDEAVLRASLEELVLAHDYEFSFDDFGPSHLAWASEYLPKMKLEEVKMSAEMKAKVVDQSLQGQSSLLEDWMQKVGKIGDFKCVVLEGSDNCAGAHPGVIFTDETRSNQGIAWASQLQKYTQAQVEDAHANVVQKIQSVFPQKMICIQGGYGVIEKQVDVSFANLCAKLGQGNVATTLGSTAWLTWAKGNTRSNEMGLC
eukprot:gnl/MRDRNA2_/MRDRNA2_84977_c0_seq1.p1 gnl/MRDRNA2_/MRDRNA2_84977_c0~~gnl/MRDRNA2_/MRDRNA2_84977_c0_seq1.p1  ORF type:complete len:459 (-),score=90.31 gnl/MRDRNA2_/MRDRNA2_84977_c0_seq1:346-1722(-)